LLKRAVVVGDGDERGKARRVVNERLDLGRELRLVEEQRKPSDERRFNCDVDEPRKPGGDSRRAPTAGSP
jgi:hypothetical protein